MKQTTAKLETNKEYIKKELRKLFRSMDFVSKKFLAVGKIGVESCFLACPAEGGAFQRVKVPSWRLTEIKKPET